MGRKPCCSKEESLNRGAWTAAEDRILADYIKIHGAGKWRYLSKRSGLKRCGKSCRLRWLNYLRPDIKRGNISQDEKQLIIRLHNLLGNRWSLIAGRLPGRTDNEIKNYWNTKIGKKLQDQQIPSSSTRNISNKCQEKLKSGAEKSVADTNSYPIRTRASKCNKVVFFSEKCDDQYQVIKDTKQTVEASALSMANCSVDEDDQNEKGAGSLPEFNLEENDLMIDFEMDEHFFNFLDTELAQFPSFDDRIGGVICTANAWDKGYYLSQNSEERSLLFSGNKLQYSDFTSLMDELSVHE